MTDDQVLERLRFLAAAQHETNTPLAIIRGWAETFATMWEDVGESDRRKGTAALERYAIALTELLEALFVDLRADAHAQAAGGTADLAEVVRYAVDQVEEARLAGEVPGLTVPVAPAALEVLLAAAASGFAMRSGAPVSVAAEEQSDGALVTVSPTDRAETTVPSQQETDAGVSGADPFDPFPGGDPSPAGIRLYAARRLAAAVGGRAWFAEDGQLRIVLPSS